MVQRRQDPAGGTHSQKPVVDPRHRCHILWKLLAGTGRHKHLTAHRTQQIHRAPRRTPALVIGDRPLVAAHSGAVPADQDDPGKRRHQPPPVRVHDLQNAVDVVTRAHRRCRAVDTGNGCRQTPRTVLLTGGMDHGHHRRESPGVDVGVDLAAGIQEQQLGNRTVFAPLDHDGVRRGRRLLHQRRGCPLRPVGGQNRRVGPVLHAHDRGPPPPTPARYPFPACPWRTGARRASGMPPNARYPSSVR